jgi:hypothetical protein
MSQALTEAIVTPVTDVERLQRVEVATRRLVEAWDRAEALCDPVDDEGTPAGSDIERHRADWDRLRAFDLVKALVAHPTTEECPVGECPLCAVRDCPHEESLHYHHDGCPTCYTDDQ